MKTRWKLQKARIEGRGPEAWCDQAREQISPVSLRMQVQIIDIDIVPQRGQNKALVIQLLLLRRVEREKTSPRLRDPPRDTAGDTDLPSS